MQDDDILASDDHVAGIGTLQIDLGDESRSFRFVEICRTRDGRISERWALTDDQQGFDELMPKLLGR